MKNSFIDVINRMQSVSGLKNGSQIAHAVGITPQAMTNYRKRDAVPAKVVVKFSNKYGISVDWLMYGTGDPYLSEMQPRQLNDEEQHRSAMASASAFNDLSKFSPEELIVIGKFIGIMRGGTYETTLAIKNIIDMMMLKNRRLEE